MPKGQYTAIVGREGDLFVSLSAPSWTSCQSRVGPWKKRRTISARRWRLFLECGDPAEVEARRSGEVYITRFEASYG